MAKVQRKLLSSFAKACIADAPECYQGGCAVEGPAEVADVDARLSTLTSSVNCDGVAGDDPVASAGACTDAVQRELAKLSVALTKCHTTCNATVVAGRLPAAGCTSPLGGSPDPASAACHLKATTKARVAIHKQCFATGAAPACYDGTPLRPDTAEGWIALFQDTAGRRVGDLTGLADFGAATFCSSPSGAFIHAHQ